MKKISKKIFNKYMDLADKARFRYFQNILLIERQLKLKTKIKDIEFVWVDGCIVGIGNQSKTMKLMQR